METKEKEYKWEDLLNIETGTILKQWFYEGVRCIIMRGPASLCCYVGVEENHPLAGMNYDDIPVQCHGGLTFASTGGGNYPIGYYWYGWDYSHSGDFSFYNEGTTNEYLLKAKKWSVKDVEDDAWGSIYDFAALKDLAESIYTKALADNNTKGK